MLMTKGLMDRALHQETALERVREKARLAGEELLELKSWKVVTEQKLKLEIGRASCRERVLVAV